MKELIELNTLGIITGLALMLIFGCISSVIGFLSGKMKDI